MSTLRPNLTWYQSKETLHLQVDHRDVKGEEIVIEEQKVSIKFPGANGTYEQVLELSKPVNKEKSKYEKTGFKINVFLEKQTPEFWTGVTANDKQIKNLKVDWNNFVDPDEEEE